MTKIRLAVLWMCLFGVACSPRPVHFMQEGPAASKAPDNPGGRIRPLWKFDTGTGYRSVDVVLWPAVQHGHVYAADPKGRVYALDTGSGHVVWETDLDLPLSSGIGLGRDRVVVVSDEGELVSLNRRDGVKDWSIQIGAEVLARPVVSKSIIVLRTGSGRVIGVDGEDGFIRWQVQHNVPGLSVRGLSTPVVIGKVVVVGYASGRLSGIDISTGRELWNAPISRPAGTNQIDRLIDIDSDPLWADGLLYVAAYQGGVSALSLKDQKIVWRNRTSTLRNLAASPEQLLVTVEDGGLSALELETGEIHWRQSAFVGRGASNPIVAGLGTTGAVGDYEGFVYLVDLERGELVGRGRVRGGAVIGLFGADRSGVFYSLSENGVISAWKVPQEG